MSGFFGNSDDSIPLEDLKDFNPRDNKKLWYNSLTTEICRPNNDGESLVPIAFQDEIHETDDAVEFGSTLMGLPSEVDYLGVKVFHDGTHQAQFVIGRQNHDDEEAGMEEKHLKRFDLNQLSGRVKSIKNFLFQER